MTSGRNSSGKVVAIRGDRNMLMAQKRLHAQMAAQLGSQVGPMGWDPLERVGDPMGAEGAAVVAQNRRCRVVGYLEPCPFQRPGGDPEQMLHLVIAARGRPLEWEEKMEVVRELCGYEREAAELYPALRRELRGERNSHLYVLPDGMEWPFGAIPEGERVRRAREAQVTEHIHAYLADKVVVFLPPPEGGAEPFRIFRDVADAATAGLEGAQLREALVAALPPPGERMEWSAEALAYRAEIEAEVEALRNRVTRELDPPQPEVASITAQTPADPEAEAAAEAAAEADLARMREELLGR